MNKNSFKKNILFSGGMILEVVLMVSIIMMIYPIINQQTIKRKTKLRDMLIVKEINTIKQVFERFLLKYIESFPKNTTCNIDLSDMKSECKVGKIIPPEGINNTNELLNKVYSMGLPSGLGRGENMLGQKYSVRVRRKSIKKSNVDIVEAIVIASGNEDVEDITIRSIVRELGFSGGYLERNAIIGMNWLDTSNWQYSKEEQGDNFTDGSLINKLNPVKADKSLLVKYKTTNVIDNTMQTDILMNNKDIKRADLVSVKSGQYVYLKANDINIIGDNTVDFQIDDKIKVNYGITYDNIDFDLGFKARNARLKISSNKDDSFKFARDLIVEDSLYITSKSRDIAPVIVTELNVEQIDSSSTPLDFQINGVLNVKKINAKQTNSNIDNNSKLKINALYTSVLGIITPNASVTYTPVFANTKDPNTTSLSPSNSPISNPCTNCVLYLGENGMNNGKLSVFDDLVVSELNRRIDGVKLGKYKIGSTKYDGIIVRYDTTLGEILKNIALEREMADFYIKKYFSDNWEGF